MTSIETSHVPTQLGHIALRVRDVEKAAHFYSDVLGLTLHRGGQRIAFLGIREDASHEIALMPLPADAPGPDPSRVGMYHMAWEMPSFEALEALHRRLIEKGVRIAGYSESNSSANVMFFDPEGNELEALWEPPADEVARIRASGAPWPRLEQVAL
ncbi:MAG TPA: VOC family protein [Tepidiformaceae bacterium]|nr:VOC family protein [Thermoflexaceae bacterium]HMS60020.1 VOC family protein [Tepidiformaceae bacterium]